MREEFDILRLGEVEKILQVSDEFWVLQVFGRCEVLEVEGVREGGYEFEFEGEACCWGGSWGRRSHRSYWNDRGK